ncbi:MAG TPA: hypothetical protein VKB76_00755, partial [Ktedonobacterales bacterium]|nr:hypothetical protein [Ktedonobacterales bacterium]
VPQGRDALRGALLLPSLIGAHQPAPIVAAGDDIRKISLTLQSQAGTVYIDGYAPVDTAPVIPGSRQGVILMTGVGDNRSIDQLVNLEQAMARSGIVFMDLTTDNLLAYKLSPADEDSVVQAVKKLELWPGVGAGKIGILGFSAGSVLACLAAADPRVRDQIAFLTLFGGLFNGIDLLRDIGRRAIDVNGKLRPWHTDPVPLQVLANTVSGDLTADEANLITNSFNTQTPLTSDEIAHLSANGAAAYHLLEGDEPAQVESNLAQLSPAIHALLDSLSPSTVAGSIHATIYLLHDRDDPFLPYTQSRDFAAMLTRIRHPHDYVEFSIFAHVEVKSGNDLTSLIGDGARLYRVLFEILAYGG